MAEPLDACEVDIRIRYAEVDQMGVLHHSRYWVYFEMGRTELLRQRGMSYADLERSGTWWMAWAQENREGLGMATSQVLIRSAEQLSW